ncbi:HK97-gp10 family putative phage morphogenesis protein [Rhizobium herbae]|uniref:HK97 gp10 family phage protein n=1 Tax=Rhizobium herbae TaxID=508661 RepID=A0ABS4EFY5_9HYPH|nr:HK97-gp10 family putative phage morphogenesis protein [Rhizobium herbae]MBP1856858.1 HK97 gp10 family phage protein [Rhizobium herbae]
MSSDGGLSSFQKRMRAIPIAVREAVEPALVKSGDELAAVMKQLAPEAQGDLKGSITVTAPGQRTPAYSQPGGSRTAQENEVLVTAGNSKVRYAHLQEYGTAHAHAQPFFWPAVRLTKKRITNRIKRAISKAVRNSKGGQ